VIRALLGIGLYDQAIDELHYAQKTWGDSSAILATLAWIFEQQGRLETGERQFSLYRSAINTMKRAYPQFMASGGEALPKPLLKVIFPIGYWDLIRKYASERDLDPYLVAALVAQESTFVASIHSYAKAVGLMQLEPPTARQYARKLNIKYSPRLLTNPESNIKIGTAMLADQIRLLGNLHLVLASYNAGIGNVRRWAADRAGLARDEFIDDIPFPQTQLYVKKILGTAEDYRRLYGTDAATTATR
jgi:soluble lytic murein transglycosylase